jgi:hypothetical protein
MSDDRTSMPAPAPEGESETGTVVPLPLLAWLPWIAAGGFALLAGFLGQAYFATRSEIIALRERGALAEIENKSLRQQMEAERILSARRISDLLATPRAQDRLAGLRVVPLVSPGGSTPSGLAVAVWDPDRQAGELAISHLPPLPPDKDYQLWIVDPQYSSPVNGGILAIGPTTSDARTPFKPDRPVTVAARFTVSVERKGGVPQAEGPIVLASQ